MEAWVLPLWKLFEDIYTLERDKVHLAVHCFEKSAQVWWRRVKKNQSSDLPPMTWEEFRGLLFMKYFPDSDKRKMKGLPQIETRKSHRAGVRAGVLALGELCPEVDSW